MSTQEDKSLPFLPESCQLDPSLARGASSYLEMYEASRHNELQRISPRPCELNLCKNMASWAFNHVAICNEDLRIMSDMNSDNAEVFAPALTQKTEEMNHISYDVTNAQGMTKVGAKTLSELYDFIRYHVPVALPDQPQPYQIRIHKDHKELVGYGEYKRTWDKVEVVQESGAAQGLNNALYAYAFNHV